MSSRPVPFHDAALPSEAFDLPSDEAPSAKAAKPRRAGPSALFTLDRLFVASVCAASVGFFAIAYTISVNDPEYFSKRLLASLPTSDIDPITTGTISGGGGPGEAMPVPRIVRDRPLVPQDFQIVMVFEDEAILSTGRELFRVKVGSSVPGLGRITGIDPTETGGTVEAEDATLRSVVQP